MSSSSAIGGIAALLGLVAAASWGLPQDREQPVEIRADEGIIDHDAGVHVLTGAVQIDQGTLRVRAATVTASIAGDRLARFVAEGQPGQPATFRQRLKPDEPFVQARAERIDYAAAQERLELRGDAVLSLGEREFASEVILWDLREGRVHARSEQPGGVRLKLPAPANAATD